MCRTPPPAKKQINNIKASPFKHPRKKKKKKRLRVPLYKQGGLRQLLQTFVGYNFMSPNIHVLFRP